MTRKRRLVHPAWLATAAVLLLAVDLALVARSDPAPTPAPRAAESPLALDERVARIAAELEKVRQLEFRQVPDVTVLAGAQLRQRVADEAAAYSPEQAELDRRVLAALGAVPADAPVREQLIRALTAEVVGFYDPDTGELVVAAGDQRDLRAVERLTLAHELQHALAGQRLTLPPFDVEGIEDDAALARRALIEGDATVTVVEYALAELTLTERLALAGEVATETGSLGGLEALPHHLRRRLVFPYESGAAFVTSLREAGGWRAVDAAYARPPTTSAEILFPVRYLEQQPPVEVETAAALAPPWAHARSGSFGAADLLFIFEAPGGDPTRALDDPLAAAAAWNGGRYQLFVDGDRSALEIVLATRRGTLCGDLTTWYERAFPDGRRHPPRGYEGLVHETGAQAAVIVCGPGTVRIGIGPDLELARAVAGR